MMGQVDIGSVARSDTAATVLVQYAAAPDFLTAASTSILATQGERRGICGYNGSPGSRAVFRARLSEIDVIAQP